MTPYFGSAYHVAAQLSTFQLINKTARLSWITDIPPRLDGMRAWRRGYKGQTLYLTPNAV